MDKDLAYAKQLLDNGKTNSSIEKLTAYIQQFPRNETAFILLGHAYRKKENWQLALNNYAKAIEINPESQAKQAYNMIIEILNFYNKDMFNQ